MKNKLFAVFLVFLCIKLFVFTACYHQVDLYGFDEVPFSFSESDKAVAMEIKAVENKQTPASRTAIPSGKSSKVFSDIIFVWDSEKIEDNGYLRVDLIVFIKYEQFILTVKESNNYWDFVITLQENQELNRGYYIFYLPLGEDVKIENAYINGSVKKAPQIIDYNVNSGGVVVLCEPTNHVFSLLFSAGLSGAPDSFEFFKKYGGNVDLSPYDVKGIVNLESSPNRTRLFKVRDYSLERADMVVAPYRQLDFVYSIWIGFGYGDSCDVVMTPRKEYYNKFDSKGFTIADFKNPNAKSLKCETYRWSTWYSEYKIILNDPTPENKKILADYLKTFSWVIDTY